MGRTVSNVIARLRHLQDAGDEAGEAAFTQEVINEARQALNERDASVDNKADAVRKLVYLHMMGADMSWAAFSVVELMSAPWFGHRRVGYLAAAQSFDKETDVLVLTTQLFKNVLTSSSGSAAGARSVGSRLGSLFRQKTKGEDSKVSGARGQELEVHAALACLCAVANKDLAVDLLDDVLALLSSSRPGVRQRAVLTVYALCAVWPEALRLSFDRLRQLLANPVADMSKKQEATAVLTVVVNVVFELARHRPSNFVALIPSLFSLLQSPLSSNWMRLKLLKLLSVMLPAEPRLLRKLLPVVNEIVRNEHSQAVLIEAIELVASVPDPGSVPADLVRLCVAQLRTRFVRNASGDTNVRLLGMRVLRLFQERFGDALDTSTKRELRALVLQCLDDAHAGTEVKKCALKLLEHMASESNLPQIVSKLLDHLEPAKDAERHAPLSTEYRGAVASLILRLCGREDYALVQDFHWHFSVLCDLAHCVNVLPQRTAGLLAAQVRDVLVRVPGLRGFGVRQCAELLLQGALLTQAQEDEGAAQLLRAVVYCVGEFREHLFGGSKYSRPAEDEEEQGGVVASECSAAVLLQHVLQPCMAGMDTRTQQTAVQAAAKLFAAALDASLRQDTQYTEGQDSQGQETPLDLLRCFESSLARFTVSADVEVQERAVAFRSLCSTLLPWLQSADAGARARAVAAQLRGLFLPTLEPVHPRAQRKVSPPACLSAQSLSALDETCDAEAEAYLAIERQSGSGLFWQQHKPADDIFGDDLDQQEEEEAAFSVSQSSRHNDPFYLRDTVSAAPSRADSSDSGEVAETSELKDVLQHDVDIDVAVRTRASDRFLGRKAKASGKTNRGKGRHKKKMHVRARVLGADLADKEVLTNRANSTGGTGTSLADVDLSAPAPVLETPEEEKKREYDRLRLVPKPVALCKSKVLQVQYMVDAAVRADGSPQRALKLRARVALSKKAASPVDVALRLCQEASFPLRLYQDEARTTEVREVSLATAVPPGKAAKCSVTLYFDLASGDTEEHSALSQTGCLLLPVQVHPTSTKQGETAKTQEDPLDGTLSLPVRVLLSPAAVDADVDELADCIASGQCPAQRQCVFTVDDTERVRNLLHQVPTSLDMRPVSAAPGSASFLAYVAPGLPVALLLQYSEGQQLQVTVRAFSDLVATAVLRHLQALTSGTV